MSEHSERGAIGAERRDRDDGATAIATLPPRGLRLRQAAAFCGISESYFIKLRNERRVPAPAFANVSNDERARDARVRICVWFAGDLELWLENGCPDEKAFDAVKKARRR